MTPLRTTVCVLVPEYSRWAQLASALWKHERRKNRPATHREMVPGQHSHPGNVLRIFDIWDNDIAYDTSRCADRIGFLMDKA